jgi:hypothetical protein
MSIFIKHLAWTGFIFNINPSKPCKQCISSAFLTLPLYDIRTIISMLYSKSQKTLMLFVLMMWDCIWISASNGHVIPQMIVYTSMEPWWNDVNMGNTKNSERNQSQCCFVHHKSHGDWLWCEPSPPQWEDGNWPPESWPSLVVLVHFKLKCVANNWSDHALWCWHHVHSSLLASAAWHHVRNLGK